MPYASAVHGLPGVFITFEGGEGVGKTTQITFMERVLKDAGLDVVRLREPGGTTVGEQLRSIVLDAKNEALDDRSELFMYEAARAQIVAEVIRPALERGSVVLCDRFVDSTVAYQGCGRGLPLEFVHAANEFACQGIVPDRTVLLTVDSAAVGLRRATRRLGADRLESAGTEFHQRVNEGFKAIAEAHPERVRVVSSTTAKSTTARAVWDAVGDVLEAAFQLDRPSEEAFKRLDRRKRGARRHGHRTAAGENGRGSAGKEGAGGRQEAGARAGQPRRRDDGGSAGKARPSGSRRKKRGDAHGRRAQGGGA